MANEKTYALNYTGERVARILTDIYDIQEDTGVDRTNWDTGTVAKWIQEYINKVTSEVFATVEYVNEKIGEITVKIPNEASSSNQLADKEWVTTNAGKIDSISVEEVEKEIVNKKVNLTLSDFGIALTDKTVPITIVDKTYATISTVFSGDQNGIPMSLINDYLFIIVSGYKQNIGGPNQTSVVLTKNNITYYSLYSSRQIANGWEYILKLDVKSNNLYLYTEPEYSGNTIFMITNVIGVKGV